MRPAMRGHDPALVFRQLTTEILAKVKALENVAKDHWVESSPQILLLVNTSVGADSAFFLFLLFALGLRPPFWKFV